jgi:hypothetical protein
MSIEYPEPNENPEGSENPEYTDPFDLANAEVQAREAQLQHIHNMLREYFPAHILLVDGTNCIRCKENGTMAQLRGLYYFVRVLSAKAR